MKRNVSDWAPLLPLLAVLVYLALIASRPLFNRSVFGSYESLNAVEALVLDDLGELQRALWAGADIASKEIVSGKVARRGEGIAVTPAQAAVMGRSTRGLRLLIANGLMIGGDEAIQLGCLALRREQPEMVAVIRQQWRVELSASECAAVGPPPWDLPLMPDLRADLTRFGAPAPDAEQFRRVEDIRRDLLAIAAREDGASQSLADDLCTLTIRAPRPEVCNGLARSLTAALSGSRLDDAGSQRLADLLYAALHMRLIPDEETARLLAAFSEELTARRTDRTAVTETLRHLEMLRQAPK